MKDRIIHRETQISTTTSSHEFMVLFVDQTHLNSTHFSLKKKKNDDGISGALQQPFFNMFVESKNLLKIWHNLLNLNNPKSAAILIRFKSFHHHLCYLMVFLKCCRLEY